MADQKKSIDDYILEIESRKIKFLDKANFLDFLYEYACQTAEYQGINPHIATNYVKYLICDRLKDLFREADNLYWDYPNINVTRFPILDNRVIPEIVRREHTPGLKYTPLFRLVPYKKR